MSLATAKHVGVVQAVSRTVSFVRYDASLSYVPEFVTKTVFISNPLPRFFLVVSLSDFAAGLDDELLLSPVRTLRISSDRDFLLFLLFLVSFFFLSPGCPSQPLSKTAVFFIPMGGILGTGAARPEVGSVEAHSVWGVSTSAAFHIA